MTPIIHKCIFKISYLLRILYTLIFIGYAQFAFAQSTDMSTTIDIDRTFIEPFPQSSVFKRYTAPQPSLATGSVNIPIELYELNFRELRIPFTLRYNTQGIKVFDDSFPYGLGWSLTPGLRVTRTIMGRPDELFERMVLNNNLDVPGCDSLRNAIHYDSYINPARRDTHSDLFTVYLIDKQLPFLLKKVNGSFMAISEATTLRIETDNALTSFTITDDNGIKYHFGSVKERYSDNPLFTTAWMVDTITMLNGDIITFEWQTAIHTSRRELTPGLLHDAAMISHPFPADVDHGYIDAGNVLSLQNTSSNDAIAQLTRVSWPLGTITLNYEYPFTSCPRLTSMSVSNNQNTQVKQVRFKHSFSGEDIGISDRMMMYLEKVDMGLDGTYEFEYNKVPIQNKWAQDWWGFYNGLTHDSIDNRVPKVRIKSYDSDLEQSFGNGIMLQCGETNRDVDTLMMKANILTKITYPTGGYSRFSYETHRWAPNASCYNHVANYGALESENVSPGYGGGLRVWRIETTADTISAPQILIYKYGNNEDGLANVEAEPLPYTFLDWHRRYEVMVPHVYAFREAVVNASSSYMKNRANVTPIWYSQVTEYKGGGKTVYQFDNLCHRNDISIEGQMERLNKLRTFASHGILKLSETAYAKVGSNYEKRRSIGYNYNLQTGPQLDIRENFSVYRECISYDPNQDEAPDIKGISIRSNEQSFVYNIPFSENERYSITPCSIELYHEQLQSVADTIFTSGNNTNGRIVNAETYTYDSHGRVKTRHFSVGGEPVKADNLYYPGERIVSANQQPFHQQLVNSNRIGTPYLKTETHNGKTLSDSIAYAAFSQVAQPYRLIHSRGNVGRITYEYDYDSLGNISSITRPAPLEKQSIVWGINGQFPVAAIAGMDYNELTATVGSSVLQSIEANNAAQSANQLRQSLADEAAVMTFDYSPLVGITSETDYGGVTRHAEYDEAGRLIRESDHTGSTIARYGYQLISATSPQEIICSIITPHVGQSVTYSLSQSESLTNSSYTWQTIDGSGAILNIGNSSSVNYLFEASGCYTIRCVIHNTLLETDDIIELPIEVLPENIGLSSINYHNRYSATAILSCHNPLSVTFTYDVYLEDGNAILQIDGAPIANPTSGKTLTRQFNAGTHYISLSMSNNASGNVVFYVSAVNGSNGETASAIQRIELPH